MYNQINIEIINNSEYTIHVLFKNNNNRNEYLSQKKVEDLVSFSWGKFNKESCNLKIKEKNNIQIPYPFDQGQTGQVYFAIQPLNNS